MGRTSRLHFLVDTGAEVSIVPPSAAQEKIDRNIHDMPLTVLLLLLEKVCFSLMCNYIAYFHGCLLCQQQVLYRRCGFFSRHFNLLVDVNIDVYCMPRHSLAFSIKDPPFSHWISPVFHHVSHWDNGTPSFKHMLANEHLRNYVSPAISLTPVYNVGSSDQHTAVGLHHHTC